MRVEKLLPPTAVPTTPVCVSGCRACPPEGLGGLRGYEQGTVDQFNWRCEVLDRLLVGEDLRKGDVPTQFCTYQPEHLDKDEVNWKLAKLY